MVRTLIAAGGTGGHVYPALALADVLRNRGHEVVFVGGDRIETRLVPEAGYPLRTLPARGLPRSVSPRAAMAGVAFLRSLAGARRIVRELGADVVVGMGGYPSLAPALAAGRLGRRVVLHEQNAMLSLAHRLSLRRARALALSLPLEGGTPERPGLRVEVTGNPLRARVRALAAAAPAERERTRRDGRAHFGLSEDAVVVLAFGGSQGAKAINDVLPALTGAWTGPASVEVLHVAGPGHEAEARSAWQGSPARAVVHGYVEDMELALAAADVVVCRSGASTVAELTAVGLPAVLVPFPHAPGGVQEANARILARAGAARIVLQGAGFAERLDAELAAVLGDADRRAGMVAAARELGRPDAAERLADLVCEVA